MRGSLGLLHRPGDVAHCRFDDSDDQRNESGEGRQPEQEVQSQQRKDQQRNDYDRQHQAMQAITPPDCFKCCCSECEHQDELCRHGAVRGEPKPFQELARDDGEAQQATKDYDAREP